LALGVWNGAWSQEADASAETASAGTYLAARAAALASDFPAAADLLAQALLFDPDDPWLLDSAVTVNLGLGRLEAARDLAARALDAGFRSPAIHLATQLANAVEGDWRGLLQDLERGTTVGPLVDGLSRAWAWQGLGDTEAAMSAFDELSAASPGLRSVSLYHKALALALQGDLAAADALLSQPEPDGFSRSRRAILAHAEVLSGLDRNPDALALIDDTFGRDLDETLLALRMRLAAGEQLPFTFVTSAAEGLSEAYLNVASALGDTEAPTALLYARAALALDPDRSEAALLAASLLETMGQPGLAREVYGLVGEEDPSFVAAELGRAALLRGEGEEEAALEVLSRLASDLPERAEVQSSLGDLLRAMERLPEAEAAYDRALALSPEDATLLWYLHFTRGLARQEQGDWPGTESDLRRSLELRPDQPQVLNHLGYSLVERGEKLTEALEMLERAVALRPDSGAIVDSLGWAFFKLGRHDEAVEQLELAATLLPTDPVINDHLGDAYWVVGREREARFQWTRALSLDPEPEEAEKIRRKLQEGLAAPAAPAAAAAVIEVSPGG
jgi:tetratricopeptide (TPR) repeat protein